jgi:selenide,water dikinase
MPNLTELVSCAGCASKLAAGELANALRDLPMQTDPRVLIDYRTSDDAGVYEWAGGPALVQTVDFFTPIVDDPFTYGQIAAANALSDVYAMGGEPITALAIAAFPPDALDRDTIRAIFLGGLDKLKEAGAALLGGHTVRDPEVKFGYAVTGAIDPDRIWANAGARVGDRLIFTKRLGTGIIGTAIKNKRAPQALVDQAVASMTTLNKTSARVLREFGDAVHACTDVTGFSLIGHSSEMAASSDVTVLLEAARLPLFEGVLEIAEQNRSGGMNTNRAHFSPGLHSDGVAPELVTVCFDPQTSGGLLASVDGDRADAIIVALRDAGVGATIIGSIVPAGDAAVRLR